MIKRHNDEIKNRLEKVYDSGHGEFSRLEMCRWYGCARVSKSVWRDLQEKWEEIREDDSSPLFVGCVGEIYILIYGKGLKNTGTDLFFRDIAAYIE